MNLYQSQMIIGLLFHAVSVGEVVQVGSSIEATNTKMEELGYKPGGLTIFHIDTIREYIGMPPKDEHDKCDLKQWLLDQGTILITYRISTGKITGITYHLCDERPKAVRKEFRFEVKTFDPETGVLTIKTATPKDGEQAGAGQPATASESKPDGDQNPQPESKPASR